MNKDFNVYQWRREHLNEANGSDEYGLGDGTTSISDLADVIPFLNNNKEKFFQIADEHKGDVIAMQTALNNFLAPYITNTPEFIVTRLKAAIGRAILQRNIAANPDSSAALKKLRGY